MIQTKYRRRILALALTAALAGQALAQAFEPFRVDDIRVDGLQRISSGTVFSYLPVERGDTLDQTSAAAAVRALFKTGFFSDIKLDRQSGILVITVVERPAINKITLTGNKELKTEELMKGLRSIGLAEGETFNPLNLDRVTQELTRQYNNRGKYSVTISPNIINLDLNRVDVTITIAEGKAAKIRDINIVGNQTYTDADIRNAWESNTSNWLSWYKRDDQYSREKLSGDLEKLNNFYLDRGYVDFNIESTQVTISPTKRDMYISVIEGEIYTFDKIEISGDTIIPEEEIQKMLAARTGETFSRQRLEVTKDAIVAVLGNIGYAFAEVQPIPSIDREKRLVSINFVIQPGPRVQVRRIEFKGNAITHDEVLRREMRQFEGSWYSQAAIDRSKVRLQRLGYFEEVDVETPEVAGEPDKVDVVINVKERQFGQFQFGLGYSQVAGTLISAQLTQNNFLGSGNRVSTSIQTNAFSESFAFSFFDPYFTDNGVSVGYSLNLSENDFGQYNLVSYKSDNQAFQTSFGLPLSETDSVGLALGIDAVDLTTTDGATAPEFIDYLIANHKSPGDRERFPCYDVDNDPSTPCDTTLAFNRMWRVNSWRAIGNWARDSRNDFFAPTRGTYHRVSLEATLPGSDFEYYKASYDFSRFWRISPGVVMETRAALAYGDSYGNSSGGLPFWQNYYAGGPDSVRGFETNTLGPRSSLDAGIITNRRGVGGALKTVGSVEFYFPGLFDSNAARVSTFVDFGNVFATSRDFGTGDLRSSAGIALQWQSPMGPISISYSLPLHDEPGDVIERLQFTFGGKF